MPRATGNGSDPDWNQCSVWVGEIQQKLNALHKIIRMDAVPTSVIVDVDNLSSDIETLALGIFGTAQKARWSAEREAEKYHALREELEDASQKQ